jgi:hypothetical protein
MTICVLAYLFKTRQEFVRPMWLISKNPQHIFNSQMLGKLLLKYKKISNKRKKDILKVIALAKICTHTRKTKSFIWAKHLNYFA